MSMNVHPLPPSALKGEGMTSQRARDRLASKLKEDGIKDAEAYAAYNTSCTTRPVSPSEIGVSLPRTQRAKCRISCGKP